MDCLIHQTLADWELIVCDSHSDDGTWEFLQPYGKDPRVRLYQVPRDGLYAGWNECLRRCQGRYIYIAPADDTCDVRLLATMTGALDSARFPVVGERELQMVMCQFDFIDEAGRVLDHFREIPASFFGELNKCKHYRSGPLELLVHLLLGVSWVTYTAVLFRRDLLAEVGYFPTDCGAWGDRLWAIKSALASGMLVIPDRLATWRVHGEQASRRVDILNEKRLCKGVSDFLTASATRLPSRCLNERGAPSTDLLHGVKRNYLIQYCLDREQLRHHPLKFLNGLFLALRHEPTYLWFRLRTGLSWNCPQYEEERSYLRRKLTSWDIPPPTVL